MEAVPDSRPSEWDKRLSTHSPLRTLGVNGQPGADGVSVTHQTTHRCMKQIEKEKHTHTQWFKYRKRDTHACVVSSDSRHLLIVWQLSRMFCVFGKHHKSVCYYPCANWTWFLFYLFFITVPCDQIGSNGRVFDEVPSGCFLGWWFDGNGLRAHVKTYLWRWHARCSTCMIWWRMVVGLVESGLHLYVVTQSSLMRMRHLWVSADMLHRTCIRFSWHVHIACWQAWHMTTGNEPLPPEDLHVLTHHTVYFPPLFIMPFSAFMTVLLCTLLFPRCFSTSLLLSSSLACSWREKHSQLRSMFLPFSRHRNR